MRAARGNAITEEPDAAVTVVGTGIKLVAQLTLEARDAIRGADVLLHTTQTPGMATWLRSLNSNDVDLTQYYAVGRDRWETYQLMVDRVLEEFQEHRNVCVAFYGHPGVYVTPSHAVVRLVRERGHVCRMLPGISAEDCLFADLGVDPGQRGWQSYDATWFLVYKPRFDTSAGLVLWQLDALGHRDYQPTRSGTNYHVLARVLAENYGSGHGITAYRAAQYPGLAPMIEQLRVIDLPEHSGMSTLYIPPGPGLPADRLVLEELGMLSR